MSSTCTIELAPPFRLATPADVPALVDFADYAGSGMPMLIWAEMAGPGRQAHTIGLEMMSSETALMSYRNAVVADLGTGAVAALISHPLPALPQPIAAGSASISIPWQELKNHACGAWHIAVLAAYPQHRGQGMGAELLQIAERLQQANSANGLSLLVADSNTGARRLYERFGFRQEASRPMVKGDWANPGDEWLLLVRRA